MEDGFMLPTYARINKQVSLRNSVNFY